MIHELHENFWANHFVFFLEFLAIFRGELKTEDCPENSATFASTTWVLPREHVEEDRKNHASRTGMIAMQDRKTRTPMMHTPKNGGRTIEVNAGATREG